MKKAESYWKKIKPYISKKNRRTMIKDDEGLLRGITNHVYVLPTKEKPTEEPEMFLANASEVYRRRTSLDYENFDQFAKDSTAAAFVELVEQDEDGVDDFFAVCSCELGVKGELRFCTKRFFFHTKLFLLGHICHHQLAVLYELKKMTPPSEEMTVGNRNRRSKGRVPKATAQINF